MEPGRALVDAPGRSTGTPPARGSPRSRPCPVVGFVAVGATGDARVADGSAVWTSPDGRAWTRVADRAALRAGRRCVG